MLQLRFVVGTKHEKVVDAVRKHLHGQWFSDGRGERRAAFAASRTDFDSPWVNWAANSIRQTTGKAPAILPNFGGSLPNDVFSEGLGLPTIWVPHSYPGCSQHAPNEHILLPVTEEALTIMAGLFWDLGEKRAGLDASTASRTKGTAMTLSTPMDSPTMPLLPPSERTSRNWSSRPRSAMRWSGTTSRSTATSRSICRKRSSRTTTRQSRCC